MMNITNVLNQVEEELTKLQEVRALLLSLDGPKLVDFYYDCHKKGIVLHHVFKDNRDFLQSIADYFNELFIGTPFHFEIQSNHTNSKQLRLLHQKLGMLGEVHLDKKQMHVWKRIYGDFISNAIQLESLEADIPRQEEKIVRYETELAKIQNSSKAMKKFRGMTPERIEKMENIVENEKDFLETARNNYKLLTEASGSAYDSFVQRHFEFKAFLTAMKALGFTHTLHVFDSKKTYIMKTKKNVHHSYASGQLTYEEGNMVFTHLGEWGENELNAEGNLTSFAFDENEFDTLYQAICEQFSEAKVNEETLVINDASGTFEIHKSGKIVVLGEDVNLHHLLRFSSIRNALCLRIKKHNEKVL